MLQMLSLENGTGLNPHLYFTLPFPKSDAQPFQNITSPQQDQLLADLTVAAITCEQGVTRGTHNGEA